MVGEHTTSRGRGGVAGAGGGECSCAAGGAVSPNPALEIYFQNHPSNARPLPPSPYIAAELALGEGLPLFPPTSESTGSIFAHSWADHPKA